MLSMYLHTLYMFTYTIYVYLYTYILKCSQCCSGWRIRLFFKLLFIYYVFEKYNLKITRIMEFEKTDIHNTRPETWDSVSIKSLCQISKKFLNAYPQFLYLYHLRPEQIFWGLASACVPQIEQRCSESLAFAANLVSMSPRLPFIAIHLFISLRAKDI